MKLIFYYLALLVFIALVGGFLVAGMNNNGDSMSMSQMLGISALLALYVVGMSLVGEGRSEDEREQHHRYLANRFALIAGTAIFSIGIIYQLFVTHELDYWLLVGLIGVNLTKIVSLIYLNYRK